MIEKTVGISDFENCIFIKKSNNVKLCDEKMEKYVKKA